MRDELPLRKCPSCRQPISNPDNTVNDLTMIDYLERKRQERREREQSERKEKLRDLLEAVSQELFRAEADLDKRKHSNVELAKEKLDVFASHAKRVFNETLIHQRENEEIAYKMASRNFGVLNDKIQLLQEHTALVMSLLEQSYINQDDLEERENEIQRAIQSNTSPLEDPSKNLWNTYIEFLLDQFVKASKLGPSADHKDSLGIAPTNKAKNKAKLICKQVAMFFVNSHLNIYL